jgi:hypothetical protein
MVSEYILGASLNTKHFDQQPTQALANHPMSSAHEAKVHQYIMKEMHLGRFLKLPAAIREQLPYGSFNPLGTVEQKGKVRVITDLKSSGINVLILKEQFGSMTLDGIPHLLQDLNVPNSKSQPPLIACEDVTAYYRQFPVRPADQPILGAISRDTCVLDRRECFGSASAPFRTTHLLDVVCWLVNQRYRMPLRHYMDNIFHVIHPATENARDTKTEAICRQLIVRRYLAQLGLPLNAHDRQLGDTVLLLGFQISTVAKTISIPVRTRLDIIALIQKLLDCPATTIRQLQSLCGKLVWACQAVPVGSTFASDIWRFNESIIRQGALSCSEGRPIFLGYVKTGKKVQRQSTDRAYSNILISNVTKYTLP